MYFLTPSTWRVRFDGVTYTLLGLHMLLPRNNIDFNNDAIDYYVLDDSIVIPAIQKGVMEIIRTLWQGLAPAQRKRSYFKHRNHRRSLDADFPYTVFKCNASAIVPILYPDSIQLALQTALAVKDSSSASRILAYASRI